MKAAELGSGALEEKGGPLRVLKAERIANMSKQRAEAVHERTVVQVSRIPRLGVDRFRPRPPF